MPDLNSVPPSPRVLGATRQPTQMAPPPVSPLPASIHVFPSNQMAVSQGTPVSAHVPALPSPYFPPAGALSGSGPPGDGPGVGPGPGPLRHPRPLTAAELHMQLEKEQEAVVNRLTRELTLLRAQNASVVSNASSTSAGAGSDASVSAAAPVQDAHSLLSGTSGFSIPSSAGRHNRTYSNTSIRSQTAPTGTSHSVVGITAPAPIRPSAPVPIRPSAAPGMSRQNSTASRRSRTNSPGPSSYSHSYDSVGPSYFQQSAVHGLRGTPSSSELSPAIVPGTARYEETAFYRAELESVKRENEALRRRIRELERTAAAATAAAAAATAAVAATGATAATASSTITTSTASHRRSESASTTASTTASTSALHAGLGSGAGITGPRESGRERVTSMLSVTSSVGVGVPEDELRVGESAASAGLHGASEATPSNRTQIGQQGPQAAH